MPSERKVGCMDHQPKWLTRILGTVKLSFRSSYTVQRSDGMSWVGPDYRHGVTFTNVERWICRFENKRSASAAVKSSGIREWLEAHKDNQRVFHLSNGNLTVQNDGTVTFVKVPKD